MFMVLGYVCCLSMVSGFVCCVSMILGYVWVHDRGLRICPHAWCPYVVDDRPTMLFWCACQRFGACLI